MAALLAAAVAAVLPGAGQSMPARPLPPPGPPAKVGRIASPGANESSGIVASRRFEGVFWTHGDSGNPPVLHAMDAAGNRLGQVRLTGAGNVDWEDIAADEQGRLYVADVGDNLRIRSEVAIYVLREPDPKAAAAPVEKKVRFRYGRGHGPVDCEALFVRAGWAYLVTKELMQAKVHRVRLDAPAEQVQEAECLGLLPSAAWITAADLSPDGRHLALLSYSAICLFDLPAPVEELADRPAASRPTASRPTCFEGLQPRRRLVNLRQAEAVCWVLPRAGDPAEPPNRLLITNEQRDIYQVWALMSEQQ